MNRESHQRLLASFGWEGRFSLAEIVGTGANGQVWKAREPETGRWVALKFLAAHRLGDVCALARMEGEGQTLQRLRAAGQHPNVVPVLDFAVTDDQGCLVMEYIPGHTLAEVMTKDGVDLEQTVLWLATTARACGWFHQLGVVHRDLKPRNILIHAETGEPVVIDFSIAKDEELVSLTMTNEAVGTAAYMAPEQFDRGHGVITPAADVYALGVILYEWLTRVRPHPGEFHHIMRRHHDEVRPAPPSALNPDVPRELECIVLKALNHRPAERYVDGTALAEDLGRFLAGEPVRARRLSLLRRLARRARRKPALTAALAAALALTGLVAWSLLTAAEAQRQRVHEARLAELLRADSWTRLQLQEAEAHLTAVAIAAPAKADKLRQAVAEDVVRDIENALLQPSLDPVDHAWLGEDALPWLGHQNHPQAATLQTHYSRRLGRWDTLLHLRPPFTDRQGFFPKVSMESTGATLRPRFDPDLRSELNAKPPTFRIKDDLTNPVEFVFTFQAEAPDFRRLRLHGFFQKQTVDVFLSRVQATPEQALSRISASGTAIHPDSLVLYLTRGKVIEAVCHIPDLDLLAQPFTLRLRVEDRRVSAAVNERWHLHLDDLFVFTSSQGSCLLEIQWPPCLGLTSLEWRCRNQPNGALMQLADRLLSEGKIQEASLLYEAMPSQTATSSEITYKLARCHEARDRLGEALELWTKVSAGPPSMWNELSTFKLWLHTARLEGIDFARPWLHRLPRQLCPQLKSIISGAEQQYIAALYGKLGRGIHALNRDSEKARDALLAFRAGNILAPKAAAALVAVLHFHRFDAEVESLLLDALSQPQRWRSEPTCLLPAIAALDFWTRITGSEASPALAAALDAWRKEQPTHPTIAAIVLQESGRRHARAGQFEAALGDLRRANALTEADARHRVSGLLTEGWLLLRLQRPGEAREKWRSALAEAGAIEKKVGPYLHELPLLRGATHTWTPALLVEYLTTLCAEEAEQTDMRDLFRSLKEDRELAACLNTVADTERGQALLRHHALRTLPARDLFWQTYALLLEHYLLSTGFPRATGAERERVRAAVDQFFTELATNPRANSSHLCAYLRAWNDPAAARTHFDQPHPYSPALTEDLHWLLAQRHSQPADRHLGAP